MKANYYRLHFLALAAAHKSNKFPKTGIQGGPGIFILASSRSHFHFTQKINIKIDKMNKSIMFNIVKGRLQTNATNKRLYCRGETDLFKLYMFR